MKFAGDFNIGNKFIKDDSGEPDIRSRGDGSPSLVNTNMTVNDYVVLTVVFNGTNGIVRVNETLAVTGSMGFQGMEEIRFGSNITLKEVIIRSVADDATERQDVVDYLNTKYTVY
jgi:hypothetical protein